jgi:hypothetical protein
MADSWLGLTLTTDKFLYDHEWLEPLGQELDPFISLIQYPGSPLKIRKITDDINVNNLAYKFTNVTKKDEFDLLTFFCEHKGRANRFWLPIPENYYQLSAPVKTGDFVLSIPNETKIVDGVETDVIPFDSTLMNGYERMFMLLNDGSWISRSIYGIAGEEMAVLPAMDRDIALSEIKLFGKLILCRFAQDYIEFNHTARDISECTLTFREIAKEYNLSEVS